MMDLSTRYMGMDLKNPLVASASPLSESIENLRRMEKAGLAAVVLHSLFEEQITLETYELHHYLSAGTESYSESLTYFPNAEEFISGPDEYLAHIRLAKQEIGIPVIASLNAHSARGWTEFARHVESAGADAIELNIYFLPTNPDQSSVQVESLYVEILKRVKAAVTIPVAVKLSPFFSALTHMARQLDQASADGLVLFNRFYQPDVDLESLEVVPNVELSTSAHMRLPLRWIAILRGQVRPSLAASGGVHEGEDALKMIMAGADIVMLCSTLLKNGLAHVHRMLADMRTWMERHEYGSIQQMKGSMSYKSGDNPAAVERANYMKAIHSGIIKTVPRGRS